MRTHLLVAIMIIGIVTLAVPALPNAHAAAGANFDNVVIVAMENQNYASVMGTGTGSSSAPFISSLLAQSSTIPSYHGYGAAGRSITGCSAGCYTALISGSDHGISDGYSCCINAPTLMDSMGTLTVRVDARGATITFHSQDSQAFRTVQTYSLAAAFQRPTS